MVPGESALVPVPSLFLFPSLQPPSSRSLEDLAQREGGWLSLQAHSFHFGQGELARKRKGNRVSIQGSIPCPREHFRTSSCSGAQPESARGGSEAGKGPSTSLHSSVSGLEVDPTRSHLGRDRDPPPGSEPRAPNSIHWAELHIEARFRILQAVLVSLPSQLIPVWLDLMGPS